MEIDLRAESAIGAAERGDIEAAKSTVIDLIAEDWNNAEAHRAWARVLRAEGKLGDAVAACRTAVSLDPRRAEMHFELAETLLAEADQTPFPLLVNWLETRQAVLDGLERSPDKLRGTHLLAAVDKRRDRVA